MYSQVSRNNTAMGSCTGLVTVGPTKEMKKINVNDNCKMLMQYNLSKLCLYDCKWEKPLLTPITIAHG